MLSNFWSKYLLFLGVHPHYPPGKLRFVFNTAVVLWYYILVGIKIYKDLNPVTLEPLGLIVLAYNYYLTYILGRRTVKHLLADSVIFWETQMDDEEMSYILLYYKRIVRLFTVIQLLGTAAFMAKPFILNEESILNIYKPDRIPFYIHYTIECYVLHFSAGSYMSIAMFICSLTTQAAAQFRALNLYIRALDLSNSDIDVCTRKLKRSIWQHQFLIRHVEYINKFLSISFAISIILGIGCLCIEMFVLTVNIGSTLIVGETLLVSCALTGQFFTVYGLSAQILMDQSTAMADVIYFELEWYLPHVVPLRKYLLLMMARSQKEVCIKAAGYHTVNNKTILIMLKTAYSFYTFLQTLS